ncbi:MAG: hypothetical protein JXB39_07870 [Deltaproteobacteria bacterium]|nr:hypothetical protein [Deltaproteobacteria bacterium]
MRVPLFPLLGLACLGCSGPEADTGTPDTDVDTDTDTDVDDPCEAGGNVDGHVTVVEGCASSPPPEVAFWTVQDGVTPCGGSDTGGSDWKDQRVGSVLVEDDDFHAWLDEDRYAVTALWQKGYGCTGFQTFPETCAEVELVLDWYTGDWAPYLYLYPERPTRVRVGLGDPERVTLSDPPYPDTGWTVRAFPDGRIETPEGERDFLFYEIALDPTRFQYDEGWCVEGRHAQASIEAALVDWGFLPTEVGDFAGFWDGEFPEADLLTVYPQVGATYPIRLDPRPDHFLRVEFVLEAGCRDVTPPGIEPMPRQGFHAAEWGLVLLDPLAQPGALVPTWM